MALATGERPNILMVTIDGARADSVAASPAFTEAFRGGTLFTRCITQAPYTFASMHATFSGTVPSRNGVDAYNNIFGYDAEKFPPLAHRLRELGYATRADLHADVILPKQGFDAIDIYDEHKVDLGDRHEAMVREAAQGPGPFFLYLHYVTIHTENVEHVFRRYTDYDPEYYAKQDANLARHNAAVERAGEYLQRVLAALEAAGLAETTAVVVISDHGLSIGERLGERAYGVFAYDYSLRTFAFVRAPGYTEGALVATQVRNIDIFPTVLGIAGARGPPSDLLTGGDLAPVASGEETADRPAFSETGGLDGPWPSPLAHNVFALRDPPWKIIRNATPGTWELYNLVADPEEKVDQSGLGIQAEARLSELLLATLDELKLDPGPRKVSE